jgi:hypothetical protein
MDEIDAAVERSCAGLKGGHLRLPNSTSLQALFSILGADRLAAMISRHKSLGDRGHFGTPDLLLYAFNKTTGTPCAFRFVDVKKPGEKVSIDQLAELRFLRGLGLKARVLRLIERN